MPLHSSVSADNVSVANGALSTSKDIPAAGLSTSAFTVLSSDSLVLSGKPNAIVRPIRRRDPREHLELFENVDPTMEMEKHSGGNNQPQPHHFGLGNFTKELDLKLRRLQNYGKKSSSKNSSNGETIAKRPLFVTTVPTGIFLQPCRDPPSASTAQVRHTYSYFSVPRILANMQSKSQFNRRLGNDVLVSVSSTNTASTAAHTRLPATATSVAAASKLSASANPHKQQQQQPLQKHHRNIMRDLPQNQRIVRGSNYAQQAGGGDAVCKEAEARRRKMLRQKMPARPQRGIIGTPPPVFGRKHEDVQTEKYLEELFARPPEYDAECQTDLFLQRPPSPPYEVAKIGVDVATDIGLGELFDFDTEVQPILETLVGRSVEQGLIEIMHEEELADMRRQQQEFLAIRETELAELRRLEAEEIRLHSEKIRRLEQEKIAQELDNEMQERVTAAKLLQGHIADLLPGVLSSIEPYLEVENREVLERELGPWLANEVAEEVGQMIDSRELLEQIVQDILEDRAARYAKMAGRESILSIDPPMDEAVEEEAGPDGDESLLIYGEDEAEAEPASGREVN